jgi:hypothetical protein
MTLPRFKGVHDGSHDRKASEMLRFPVTRWQAIV